MVWRCKNKSVVYRGSKSGSRVTSRKTARPRPYSATTTIRLGGGPCGSGGGGGDGGGSSTGAGLVAMGWTKPPPGGGGCAIMGEGRRIKPSSMATGPGCWLRRA